MKENQLEKINRENLLKGLDSEGREMPFYSDSEYGYEKFISNPSNNGHWDLKNTGQYHEGIFVKVNLKDVFFRQRFNNKKVRWLDMMLDQANRNPLGITEEQFVKVQMQNKPKLKEQIDKIINGTT